MSTDANQPPNPDDRLRDAFLAESDEDMRSALAAGANPNMRFNNMPLVYYAAQNMNLETLDLLIAKGADLNATDSAGLTATMMLAWIGRDPKHIEALARLIAAGADLSVKSPLGLTALDLSKSFPNPAASELLQNAHAPPGRHPPPRRDDGWKIH